MSSARAQDARSTTTGPAARLLRAWRQLTPEQRLAAIAAAALFLTLFLPWYQETVIVRSLRSTSASLSGWAAFSWVEAAVLLVAVGVLVLLFARAEGHAFHLPGGDGTVITVAGAWTCLLVIWRIFDKQGTSTAHQFISTSGIEWGIFVALGVAGLLTYAGTRIRAARRPEPPLPTEDGAVFDGHWHRPGFGHGGPASGPAAGTGASARSARRAAERARSAPVTEAYRAAPEPAARPSAAPPDTHRSFPYPASEDPTVRVADTPEQRERTSGRSTWRPAEKPEWSEPERAVGWLSAPLAPHPPEPAATPELAATLGPAATPESAPPGAGALPGDDATLRIPPRPFPAGEDPTTPIDRPWREDAWREDRRPPGA